MTAKKKPAKDKARFNFEDTMERLADIAEVLESDDTSLEDSLKAFEEGVKLTREAQKVLREAEQKLQVLVEENGEPVARDLDLAEENE